jgi:5'-methylthioadenosine phosphorylase
MSAIMGLAAAVLFSGPAAAQTVPCKATIAFIGGTHINDAMTKSGLLGAKFTVETPVGTSPEIYCGKAGGIPFYFVDSHGQGKLIEMWAAFRQLHVTEAIGGATAGGINPAMKVRDYVVPDDFIDYNVDRPRRLPASLFGPGELILPRYSPATDPLLSEILVQTARARLAKDAALADVTVHSKGVVAQAAGGRFETPAEIRMMAKAGNDLVTMNVGTEIAFSRMAGINYACLVLISNPAEGLAPWDFKDLSAIYRTFNTVSLDVLTMALPKIAALAGKPRLLDSMRVHPELTSDGK